MLRHQLKTTETRLWGEGVGWVSVVGVDFKTNLRGRVREKLEGWLAIGRGGVIETQRKSMKAEKSDCRQPFTNSRILMPMGASPLEAD